MLRLIPLRCLLICLVAAIPSTPLSRGAATFEVIQEFSIPGVFPWAALVADAEGNLYGTTEDGGAHSNSGIAFKRTPEGVVTTLYHFAEDLPYKSRLCLGSDGWLYGTSFEGGAENKGVIYRISKEGTYQKLHDFGPVGPGKPWGALIEVGPGDFYGVTGLGGVPDLGTIYRFRVDTGITVLHEIQPNEGAQPNGALVVGNDGKLYGGTQRTLFRLSTSVGYETLFTFPYNAVDNSYPTAG